MSRRYAVKIYSNTLGLSSSVRITGGKAQDILKFSDIVETYVGANSLPEWVVTIDLSRNIVRFTTDTDPTRVDLLGIVAGDYVNIYGSEFNVGNRGSFPITAVDVTYPGGTLTQYFEIENLDAFEQTVTQLDENSMVFYRPFKNTTQKPNSRTVLVAQHDNEIDVSYPATSSVVHRTLETGSYLHENNDILIDYLARSLSKEDHNKVTIETIDPHGLAAGDQIIIENAYGNTEKPFVFAGDPLGTPATTDASITTNSSLFDSDTTLFRNHTVILNSYDSKVLLVGSVSAPTVNRFTVLGKDVQPNGADKIEYEWDLADISSTSADFNFMFKAGGSYLDLVPNNDPTLQFSAFVCGGINSTETTLTDAIDGYAPLLDQWTDSGITLTEPRAGHAISWSQAGYFYISGGVTNIGATLETGTSIEYFDPFNLTSTYFGDLTFPRALHQQIELDDFSVLVVGGRGTFATVDGKLDFPSSLDDTLHTLSSCEIITGFNPTTEVVGSMAYSRIYHKLVKLPDGRVMVIGGTGFNSRQSNQFTAATNPVSLCEIYDPVKKFWSPAGHLAYFREDPMVEYVASTNCIYVWGGGDVTTSGFIEIYNVSTGKWSFSIANEPYSYRLGAKSVSLEDGIFLMTGGKTYNPITATYNSGEEEQAIVAIGHETVMSGGLNEMHTIVETSPNILIYETSEYNNWTENISTDIKVIPVKAQTSSRQGPYIWDTNGSPAITGENSFLIQNIAAGAQYATLNVANSSDLTINEIGETIICIGFGKQNQAYPIKVFDILSDTSLKIDYNHVFQEDILITQIDAPIGSITRSSSTVTVTLTEPHGLELGQQFYITPGENNFASGVKVVTSIFNNLIFTYTEAGSNTSNTVVLTIIPDTISVNKLLNRDIYAPDLTNLALHVTAANSGRIIAEKFIDAKAPAGIKLNKTVVFPSDRGLGNEGYPAKDNYKLSEKVEVWGSDNLDEIDDLKDEE